MKQSQNLLGNFYFNSRPPHGGRPSPAHFLLMYYPLQLTTSTRRSTGNPCGRAEYICTSTHDLHTEVDSLSLICPIKSDTSTHDLHTEVDPYNPIDGTPICVLQLTTSTRRSTCRKHSACFRLVYFNSRPPHGGRLKFTNRANSAITTSTHDLHTEVDDAGHILGGSSNSYFNSRPPHGGRRLVRLSPALSMVLQLTTSTRRSTIQEMADDGSLALQLTTSTRRSTGSGYLP